MTLGLLAPRLLTPTSLSRLSALSSLSAERGLCVGKPSLQLAAERVVEHSDDRVSQITERVFAVVIFIYLNLINQ